LSRRRRFRVALFVLGAFLLATAGWGQWRRRASRESSGIPQWENDPEFASDVFTFVRIQYGSQWGGRGRGRRGGGGWDTDYPDSDWNISYRLQQLTALKVHPEGKVIELTDKELFDHPFIYLIEPGRLYFTEDEVLALRKYLLNGGFLMVDDFWGDDEWENFYDQIKRVFPDREPQELPLEHEIFHCVYDLKEKPQVPSIDWAERGISYEPRPGSPTDVPYYKALFDDRGRMMAIICHNTDLGDGWEREAEGEWYFREYSEKKAYPMGINIITYAMTH
jgi:hypothetical protein